MTTTTRKKVLVVDDHPIVRDGLAQLIATQPDLAVCGEAEDAWTALKVVEDQHPDVALVDISLKDSSGIDLIRDIHTRWPKLPVLVLSMHSESFYAERVLRTGANGYVTKGEPSDKVLKGIRRVLAGQVYVSERVAAKVMGKLVGGRQAPQSEAIDRLTDREFEVLRLLGQGLQTREVAEELRLSVKTIDTHRENIKLKLECKDATQLLKTAIQWVQFDQGS